MNNSNIMQGNTGGTQTVTVAPTQIAEVLALVQQIRQALPGLHLPEDEIQPVVVSLNSLESQAQLPRPSKEIIGVFLRSLFASLSTNVAANVAAQPIIEQLKQLLPYFGS